MARALAKGLAEQKVFTPAQLAASARSEASREKFFALFPGEKPAWMSNVELVQACDVVVLAIKPQQFGDVLPTLAEVSAGKLFVSIAAGISIGKIEKQLDPTARVIRAMPNTPSLIGYGVSGYAVGSKTTESDAAIAQQILGSVGHAFQLEESHLNAVTALSGSGPAYVFYFIEALIEAGVAQGLPVALARSLAQHTVLGAAQMVVQTGETPSVLAEQVKSPGGTTMAGCRVLEEGGLNTLIAAAVEAACLRAQELGS